MLWSGEAQRKGAAFVWLGPQRLLQQGSSLIILALPWTSLEWSRIYLRTRLGGPTRVVVNPVMSETRTSLS